jgi:acyl carrier protein
VITKEDSPVNIENDLIDFIAKAGKIPKSEINTTLEIYNSGIISSLVIIELMAFIETRYQVVIKPEKLVEDNFRDIQTLSTFVRSLLRAPAVSMN